MPVGHFDTVGLTNLWTCTLPVTWKNVWAIAHASMLSMFSLLSLKTAVCYDKQQTLLTFYYFSLIVPFMMVKGSKCCTSRVMRTRAHNAAVPVVTVVLQHAIIDCSLRDRGKNKGGLFSFSRLFIAVCQ